jgi:two-component system phosphate regulon sensor histidine kinase PhoR
MAIKEATNKTIKEATRMNRIIIEMLELSKLESNAHPKLESVAINKIINEIIEEHHKLLTEKSISLKLNLDSVNLTMDYNHAFEMIRNLIDNAIKYNKVNGELEISLTLQKLTITDTGIGIALDDQLRVFERFYRVDKGKSKEMGGTGLGLAIVKHICNLYNFKINLQSEIDRGTTIEIIFF